MMNVPCTGAPRVRKKVREGSEGRVNEMLEVNFEVVEGTGVDHEGQDAVSSGDWYFYVKMFRISVFELQKRRYLRTDLQTGIVC